MDDEKRSKRTKSEPNTSPPPAAEPKPKRKRKAASADEGEAKPKRKAAAAAAKPSITQAETLGKKRARKPKAAAAAELAAKDGGSLRSVRLSDAAFAGKLLGKYGWAIGAPKGRTAIVHRDGATGAMRPASRSMHVDMHIRNVRPLLQLYARVFATVLPPKPTGASRREGVRPAGATPEGRGGASAAKTAASTPAIAASGTLRFESILGASTRSVTEVRRIWETFRVTTTSLRRIETLQRTALSAPGRLTSVAARGLVGPSGRRTVQDAPARDASRGGGVGGGEARAAREVVEGVVADSRSSVARRKPADETTGDESVVARVNDVIRREPVPAALLRLVHAKAQGGEAAMRLRVSPFPAKPTATGSNRASAEAPRADAASQAPMSMPIAAMRRTSAGALPLRRAVRRTEASAPAKAHEVVSSSKPAAPRGPNDEVAPAVVVPPIVTVTSAGVSPLRPVYRVERRGPEDDGSSARSFERSSLQVVIRHMTRLVSHSSASERTITVVRRLIERAAGRPKAIGSATPSGGDIRSGSPPGENGGAAVPPGVTQRQADRAPARSASVAGERASAPSMVPLRAGRLAALVVSARTTGTRSPEAIAAREARRPAASASARAAAVAPLQRRVAEGKPLAALVPVTATALATALQAVRGSGPKPVALIARLMTVVERRGWTPATRDPYAGRAAEARSSEQVPAARHGGETAVRVAGTPAPVGMVQRRPIVLVRGGMGAARAVLAKSTPSPAQRQPPTPRGATTVRKAAKTPPMTGGRERPSPASVAPTSARTTMDVRRFADRITQRFRDRYTERLTVRFAERAAQVKGRSTPMTFVGSAAASDGGSRASARPALQTVRATWSRREPERVAAEARRRNADATSMAETAPHAPAASASGPIAAGRGIERSPSAATAGRSPMLHRSARRATLFGGGPFQAAAAASRLSPMQRAPQTHRAAAVRASAPARLAPSASAAARASAPLAPSAQTHRAVGEAPAQRAVAHRAVGEAPAQRAVAHRAALVHRASPPSFAARRGIATVRSGATIGHAVTESTVAPAQRYVRDIRLDVAAKNGGRERPTQDPVVQTLQTAVKSVEAELQKAKELWAKPKLDMNRLSDQLYKELSKRIRFDSQRRGL
ncbi:hypothetical protein [Paenibacillus sp.]|uniref:hypothetical protein n=1 Tax=Paenibacillus sp. TaxID=58172 RepID=UPI002811731B|nr:hypothetical protein [Paenibacillus sp.]